MTEDGPSKNDLQAVFRKLKAAPANKVCFDCGARNPSWSSVTYGVFICIDCSATHRGLGVHITFVRSTNLDTNYTWLQLRAMQVGGNANATQFFKQHGCNTSDAQQKYKSRAASLYRDKLLQMATQAHRIHGTHNLFLESAPLSPEIAADVDFFDAHSQDFPQSVDIPHNSSSASISSDAYIGHTQETDATAGPNVDHVVADEETTSADPHKSTIIGKKAMVKKATGGKKGGLGAQRMKTDFSDIEQKATDFDKVKDAKMQITVQERVGDGDNRPKEDVAQLSARLTMQSIDEQHKAHEKLKAADPRKAEVVDRLGMGGGRLGRPAGVSHSISAGIKTIQQEGAGGTARKAQVMRETSDQWEIITKESITRNDDDLFTSKKSNEEFFDAWDTPPAAEEKKPATARAPRAAPAPIQASDEGIQKKFGNAKAISSDQYFGGGIRDYETKSNLARFEGSTAIGSADLFGNGQAKDAASGYSSHVPELADIKDSVRQGVSKVAGKISSISSSMSSYLSDRY